MSELLLLHHAQGQTPGVAALADRIAGAGHAVHAWRTLRVTSRA
ncbi:hypothetical protein [Nocardioides immobilis]|nr:hypothetical protein [Nocardioides immobilis]